MSMKIQLITHTNVHFNFFFSKNDPVHIVLRDCPEMFKCTAISTYTHISVQNNVHDLSCTEMPVCFLRYYYYYLMYENTLSNKNTNTYNIYIELGANYATYSHPSSRTMEIRHRKVFAKL